MLLNQQKFPSPEPSNFSTHLAQISYKTTSWNFVTCSDLCCVRESGRKWTNRLGKNHIEQKHLTVYFPFFAEACLTCWCPRSEQEATSTSDRWCQKFMQHSDTSSQTILAWKIHYTMTQFDPVLAGYMPSGGHCVLVLTTMHTTLQYHLYLWFNKYPNNGNKASLAMLSCISQTCIFYSKVFNNRDNILRFFFPYILLELRLYLGTDNVFALPNMNSTRDNVMM